ncbi:hypothetical protein FB157_1331, partial [Streptomyces sp. BK340]
MVAAAAGGPQAVRSERFALHRAATDLWEDRVTVSSPAADTPPARYDDLRAMVINCTLKRSPEVSNT